MANTILMPGYHATAKITITFNVAIPCTATIWLSKDLTNGSSPVATSSVNFTSVVGSQTIPISVTMPATGGSFGTFLDLTSGGQLLEQCADTTNLVIIPSVSTPVITWS